MLSILSVKLTSAADVIVLKWNCVWLYPFEENSVTRQYTISTIKKTEFCTRSKVSFTFILLVRNYAINIEFRENFKIMFLYFQFLSFFVNITISNFGCLINFSTKIYWNVFLKIILVLFILTNYLNKEYMRKGEYMKSTLR